MTHLKHYSSPSVRGPYLPTLKELPHVGYFDYNRFFHLPWGHEFPPVNVTETSKSFEIELIVPGYDKKDLNISVEDNFLTVSAESKRTEEKKEGKHTQKQFELNSFTRSFHLPPNVNEEGVQARYDNGVLIITLAKKSIIASKPKKVVEVK